MKLREPKYTRTETHEHMDADYSEWDLDHVKKKVLGMMHIKPIRKCDLP